MAKKHPYAKADKFIIFNEDPNLQPIKVWLPKPPPPELIDNYGMLVPHQKFKRQEIPHQLQKLMQSVKNVDELWGVLDKQRLKYKDEINWIKKQWYYRLNGYWFYNCGKPTYITGVNFFWLNYYNLDVGLPEYRDRDRKFFIFAEFCYNDTTTFETLRYDEKGKRVPNMYGDKLIDVGRRVCAGFFYPKFRREGATFKAECFALEMMSRTLNGISGIQSLSEKSAEKVYKIHLLRPYLKLPFFFRPLQAGKVDKGSQIDFEAAITNTAGGAIVYKQGLNSSMTCGSSEIGIYDGYKLFFYHPDELGKAKEVDVYKRHHVVKICLVEQKGAKIVGFGIGTSTVGEMTNAGGGNFFKLCNEADYYTRSENGLTPSYFYNLFISSEDGMLIDEWGNSLKEKSRKHITAECDMFLQKGDTEGWAEAKRTNPLTYSDCWIQSNSGMGFNQFVLETTIAELLFNRNKAKYYDLVRENPNDINSRVHQVLNPNGRFCMSIMLPESETNNYYHDGNSFRPTKDVFNTGADAYRFSEGGISDGGIVTRYRRDKVADPIDKPISEWVSDRIIVDYRYRPETQDDFCDDVLKVCQLLGSYCIPETNVECVLEYFMRVGYRGFLKRLKKADGTWEKREGRHLDGGVNKQTDFSLIRDSISRRGAYELHIEVLKEAQQITKPSELTDYDRLAAWGCALAGEMTNYDEIFNTQIREEPMHVIRQKNYTMSRY